MRHAFLITCYKDVGMLQNLVNDALRIKTSKIFICIIKGSEDFNKITLNKFRKYNKRVNISFFYSKWGSVNHYNAFISLLNKAMKSKCNYFHWLDNRTQIIVNREKFINFFEKNKNYSFLDIFKIPSKKWKFYSGGLDRIKYYHLTDLINLDFKNNKYLFSILNFFYIFIQKFLLINRLHFKKYYGGQGFLSLSLNAAKYIIQHYKFYKKRLKSTFLAEEIISHTILMNAPKKIRHKIINKNLIYQNWSRKHNEVPAILDYKDLKYIKNPKKSYIFARKFSSKIKSSQSLKNFFKF